MDSLIQLHPDMPMRKAFDLACETDQYLITNGKDVGICPTVLPGWRKVAVHIKTTPTPPLAA